LCGVHSSLFACFVLRGFVFCKIEAVAKAALFASQPDQHQPRSHLEAAAAAATTAAAAAATAADSGVAKSMLLHNPHASPNDGGAGSGSSDCGFEPVSIFGV
jgi:hypothetical protein